MLTRLGLLTALILAFTQPFFAEKSALKKKEIVFYLDDSFSMQAKKDGTTLLEEVVQSLIKAVPEDAIFTLFTNEQVFRQVSIEAIQNQLLTLPYSLEQLTLEEIGLKGTSIFSDDPTAEKNLILLSDFQTSMAPVNNDSVPGVRIHLVQMAPDQINNISIDSAYVSNNTLDNKELVTELTATDGIESVPVSLYNNDTLIAKTAANFDEDKKARVVFTLPGNELVNGKLEITDPSLTYDNSLYFNINKSEKINVLSIGNTSHDFAKRIFTDDEFRFNSFPLQNLNYSNLAAQNLIILNELPRIPTALITNLKSYTENGGHLVVIPSIESDVDSYNVLLSDYFSSALTQKVTTEKNVTDIAFSHPLYQNVFEKKVANFQYPKVTNHYGLRTNAPKLLSFQDGLPFLRGIGNYYIFTAAISKENSNFSSSPLIVPTFYNMAVNSLRLPPVYTTIGQKSSLDINTTLPKDHILKVVKDSYEFIPIQQSLANKVSISFNGELKEDGIYNIKKDDTVLSNLSFNYPRVESNLTYMRIDQIQAATQAASVTALFDTMEKDNRVTELWKWFVILALLLLLAEILIQKFVR